MLDPRKLRDKAVALAPPRLSPRGSRRIPRESEATVRSYGSDSPEAPTLTLVSAVAGGVTIQWNKAGWTGVKIQGRTGGGGWSEVGVDLYSPFVDTRPLAAPGQPEAREYRACYLDGDEVQAAFSQVLQVTVTP